MKKAVMLLALLAGTLFAQDGEEVYKTYCSSCHRMQGLKSADDKALMRQKMQNASPQERALLRAQMQEEMKQSGILAPSMSKVAQRIKMMRGSQEAFVAFVTGYIQNPSQEKGLFPPKIYERFGTMAPIGQGMRAEERENVAVWMYTAFDNNSSVNGKGR